MIILIKQALINIEIIHLVLNEKCNKVKLDDSESSNKSLVITIQEGFNKLKTWI